MSTSLVIDPQAIENLRALDPGANDEFLREIVGIFLEDTPLRLVELDEAMASLDSGKFVRAAHSIKGSSSNIGAEALRVVAEELEHRSKHEALPSLDALVDGVKSEFERAKTELAQLIR